LFALIFILNRKTNFWANRAEVRNLQKFQKANQSSNDHMYRKHVLGKKSNFRGIIIGEYIEKIVTLKILDVCNLPIIHKLMSIEKN